MKDKMLGKQLKVIKKEINDEWNLVDQDVKKFKKCRTMEKNEGGFFNKNPQSSDNLLECCNTSLTGAQTHVGRIHVLKNQLRLLKSGASSEDQEEIQEEIDDLDKLETQVAGE